MSEHCQDCPAHRMHVVGYPHVVSGEVPCPGCGHEAELTQLREAVRTKNAHGIAVCQALRISTDQDEDGIIKSCKRLREENARLKQDRLEHEECFGELHGEEAAELTRLRAREEAAQEMAVLLKPFYDAYRRFEEAGA